MMKKKSTLLLFGAAALLLTGCGGKKANSKVISKESYNISVIAVEENEINEEIKNIIADELARVSKERNEDINVENVYTDGDEKRLGEIIADAEENKTDVIIALDNETSEGLYNYETEINTIYITNSYELKKSLGYTNCIYYEQNVKGVFEMMSAVDPELKTVGILYDGNNNYSSYYVNAAKEICEKQGISCIEKTAEDSEGAVQAAREFADEGVAAVFSPEEGALLESERDVSSVLAEEGIPHYTTSAIFANYGAFAGYGSSIEKAGNKAADYTVNILINENGEAPQGPSTISAAEVCVNKTTANAIDKDYAPIKQICGKIITVE